MRKLVEDVLHGSARWSYLCVFLVGIAHRLALWFLYRTDLRALAEANPDWFTRQLLPLEMLRINATAALLYLQQTPPIPNLVMVGAAKWLAWPGDTADALVLLQGAISVATALLLVHVLLELFATRPVVATVIGVAFTLNTDLVVMEYNSLGQTFYENLSMLFALAVVALLIEYRRRGRTRTVLALGVVVALLALTRASWSYFAIPAAVMVAVMSRTSRLHSVGLFVVPVLLLHGGWSLKNWIVFRDLSPATSTWAGWNLANGIVHAGFQNEFREFVATHRAHDQEPLHCFIVEPGWPFATPSETDADREIAARTGLTQPPCNTIGFRLASDGCRDAVGSFCSASPSTCVRKVWRAYRLFWQPMANYGRMFIDLFAVENRIMDSFDLIGIARLLAAGKLPERQYLVSGTFGHKQFMPVELYTLRWLEPMILIANVIAVHLLAPVLLIWWWLRPPKKEALRQRRAALLIALIVYGYLAAVGSVAEYGENMRFRLDVVAIIWLITAISFLDVFGSRRGSAAHVG